MKKILRRLLKTTAVLLLLAVIGIVVFMEFYAPYWVIQPQRNTEDKSPAYYGQNFDSIEIMTHDSLRLQGYWVSSSAAQTKGTVILVHGIRGFKEFWWWADIPQQLQANGFNVVAFDNRAHGKSEGTYCTYGYNEKRDVSAIVDYIEKRQPNSPVVVWGHSLGGCIAIMALEHDPRIDAGIVESTFTDLHQIVYDYQQRMFKGWGARFLSDRVTNKAAEIANFDPYSVNPLRSVQRIKQPVFLSHGTADNKIKFEYGQNLFDKLGTACKQFYAIPQARHIRLWQTGGNDYHRAILGFLLENSF